MRASRARPRTDAVADGIGLQAPAKLNLGLRVLGRRADGYHLLQSLVVFLDLADELALRPALRWRLKLGGPFAGQIEHGENLALRAGRALARHAMADIAGCADLAAEIDLRKHIPVAAGLGGGSADAAAVLRGLNAIWGLNLPLADLQRIAAPLGADLAVCLAGASALVGGIGERIEPVPLPALSLVVVNPGLPLSTRDVFARLQPPYATELPAPRLDTQANAVDFAQALGNGLMPAAIALCPIIVNVLAEIDALSGCRLAQMSGSGATCFGLFDDDAAAEAAAAQLKLARPGWFVRACRSIAT